MYFLWLDDVRPVPPNVSSFIANDLIHIARNVSEAKKIINKHGWPLIISFDDHLGDGKPNSIALAKWMINRAKKQSLPANFMYRIHSDTQPSELSALLSAHLNQ